MKSEPQLKLIHSDFPKCTSCNQVLQQNKTVGGISLKCFNEQIAASNK